MAGSDRGTASRAPRRCPCGVWERGAGPGGNEKGSRRGCRRTANDVQPCRSTRAHRPTQQSTPPSRFGAPWRGGPSPLGGQVLGAGQETLLHMVSPKQGSPRRVRRSWPTWAPTLSRPPPMPRGRRGSTSARTHPLPPSSRPSFHKRDRFTPSCTVFRARETTAGLAKWSREVRVRGRSASAHRRPPDSHRRRTRPSTRSR